MGPNSSYDPRKLVVTPLTPPLHAENLTILNDAIQESHFLARRHPISKDESTAFLASFEHNPNFLYLVATCEGRVVGHVYALPRPDDLLAHIAVIGYTVAPAFRRRGACSVLLRRLIENAAERTNLEILFAEVVEDNVASMAVLRHFGFTEVGRIRRGLKVAQDHYLDLVLFSLHLRPG